MGPFYVVLALAWKVSGSGVSGERPQGESLLYGDAMTPKIKIHDGIVGGLVFGSVALSYLVDPRFIALAGLTGAIMISSAVTGFCPVHFLVNRFYR